ncbi:cell division protein, partial [Robertkochia marina]
MPIIELTTYIKSERKIVFDLARSIDLHKIST